MKFIQVPAGFSLELFASEPDIVKPISFTFDERGRLWVIEAIELSRTTSATASRATIESRFVEDTNGDGKADKFTVFADHLNLATSLTFANGGIIVAAAPHMLFLKDTDGDGKADVRADPEHRLGHPRHARRTVQPAVRARTTTSGARSATPASTAR